MAASAPPTTCAASFPGLPTAQRDTTREHLRKVHDDKHGRHSLGFQHSPEIGHFSPKQGLKTYLEG